MDFPFVNKEGKLYEAFPMVRLHMNTGDVISLNFFMNKWKEFVPTRYMEKSDNDFMPLISYHTKFISSADVMKKFYTLSKEDMYSDNMNFLKISADEYINWDMICKVEIIMKHYIVCFDDVKWREKIALINCEPRLVTDLSELDDNKEIVKDNNTKKEIDFGFLNKGAELFEM